MLWYLIYQMLLIAVHSVCAAGLMLLFRKRRRELFLWAALVFCCQLLDDGAVLTGGVIPMLLYERVAGAANSPAVTVLKELISICTFYFMRRLCAQVCAERVTGRESAVWAALGCIVIADKCLPQRGSLAALMVIFLIYTAEYMFTFIRALILLKKRRGEEYGPWRYVFAASLACYVLGGMLNVLMMCGYPVRNVFGDALWLAYSAAAIVWLMRESARSGERSRQLDMLEMRDRYGLTEREAEVMRLIADGKSNPDVCAALHIAPGTVKTHTYNIYRKLGIGSRSQLQALAAEVWKM